MKKIIELKNVNITMDNRQILTGITWSVGKNENWAVIGQNGSGKSFLLQLLSANIQPSSGTVELFGEMFGRVSLWELKKKIGVVSDMLLRQYHDNYKTIDVVCSGYFSSIGIYDKITAKMLNDAINILKELKITHLRHKRVCELSHGEQKRVLIARALVFNPKLLVFDEPCNGLDIPSREKFLKLAQNLSKKGHNIIFVTHHIEEIMPFINNVMLIKDGKIYAKGQKEDMMKKEMLNRVLNFKFNVTEKSGRYWPKH